MYMYVYVRTALLLHEHVPVGILHGLSVALVPLSVAVLEHLLILGQFGCNLLWSLKGHIDRHGYTGGGQRSECTTWGHHRDSVYIYTLRKCT